MVVTSLTLVLGISSLVLLLLGYTYAVLFMVKYIYVKKILVPIVATVAFCTGSFYLGPSVSFLSLVFTGNNIAPATYYILSYVWLPIGTLSINLMALTVFKPSLRKAVVIIYGAISIVFWILMFGFTDQQFTTEPVGADELLDVSHSGGALVIVAVTLLSVLVLDAGGFFMLSRKLKKRDFPKKDVQKAFMIGLGWLIFVIVGSIDSLVPPQTVVLAIAIRVIMLLAFNLIYLGFWSKPVKLE
ncbi:MAG: hypothetical protein ACTSRK_04135 [Promethearchaeota archaeon]